MSSRIGDLVKRSMKLSTVGGLGLLLFGCAARQTGATVADVARARDQAGRGATIFTAECAQCHGQRGEGVGAAPAILGEGALPEYPRGAGSSGDPTLTDPQQMQIQMQSRPAGAASRDAFRNAQYLYTFISTRMPKSRPGKLSPADDWAVVNFLFAAQGAALPTGGIGPTNATAALIPSR